MKRHLVLIILFVSFVFLVLPTQIFANEESLLQEAHDNKSEGVLPSGTKESEIEKIIEEYIEANKETTASVSLAIFRGDQTIYKTAYGYSNIETGIKADDETIYEWGSVGKLLVWVSVMQLWEQGKIDLEIDVREYLPENFFTRLKYDKPVTMINLMNHNAGFDDTVFRMCAEDGESLLSLEEALRETEPHHVHEPGAVISYSNWGAALAGYIVERISGQPFFEYVHDNIFIPLDMNHSGLLPTYEDNPWVGNKLLESQGYTADLEPMELGLFYINLYPAGSVAGTLNDLQKFAQALIPNTKGSAKLFEKKETLSQMHLPTAKYPGTEIDLSNHGLWSHEYSIQALGHGGNTNMYSSYLLIDPVSSVGLVILTNQGSEFTYNYGVPPLVFGPIGQMAHEDGKADLSDMEGLYYGTRTIKNGIGKMYTLLNIQPYILDDEGNVNTNLLGLARLYGRQVAPNTFILTQEVGSIELDSIMRYSKENGIKKLSSTYVDTLEADADIWACLIATILFAVALVWSGITLVFNIIRFIIRKIRSPYKRQDAFKKYQLILSLGIQLALVNVILLAQKMFSMSASRLSLIPNIIGSIILAILPIGYALLLYYKWPIIVNSRSSSNIQRISYIITMLMGLAMTFFVIIFEMYKI